MMDRERRQRRLLAVRDLQANLAAAELRTLRARQQELREDLSRWQGMLRLEAPTAVAAHGDWLLACAESEIAVVRSEGVALQMAEQARAIEAQAAEERERRVAREQMQRLCDRTASLARAADERTTQARLDDIFSAARLRRNVTSAQAVDPDISVGF